MKHEYELGFIIPSSVVEQDTQGVIDRVRGWIEELGGEVTDIDYWGRRRLAYPIADFLEGYYVFFTMALPGDSVPELERNLLLYDQVIRHLVVRPED